MKTIEEVKAWCEAMVAEDIKFLPIDDNPRWVEGHIDALNELLAWIETK